MLDARPGDAPRFCHGRVQPRAHGPQQFSQAPARWRRCRRHRAHSFPVAGMIARAPLPSPLTESIRERSLSARSNSSTLSEDAGHQRCGQRRSVVDEDPPRFECARAEPLRSLLGLPTEGWRTDERIATRTAPRTLPPCGGCGGASSLAGRSSPLAALGVEPFGLTSARRRRRPYGRSRHAEAPR